MDDAPFAKRDDKDPLRYRQLTDNPAIQPDMVSPAVEGYFRIPAIWVGLEPHAAIVAVLNPAVHHARVICKTLRCGIITLVLRDGTFLFDFRDWPLAPVVIIPGYDRPDRGLSFKIPIDTTKAEELAESYAVLRAQLMNVHQACLSTAEYTVKRRGAAMGFPVTSWNTEKALSWNTARNYNDHVEDIHALARNVLNNKDRVRRHPLGRRVIEIEVVEHSFDLLDQILLEGDINFIQLVEAAYVATCRQRERRYGEAVVLAWGVCERLISSAWNKMIDDLRTRTADGERMPKERRDKLKSRNYTASVMVEMLEVNGRISNDLYRLLEVARKARNNWIHGMRSPRSRDAMICVRAAQQLLSHLKGIELSLQFSGRGGVPEWPYWMWQEVKDHR